MTFGQFLKYYFSINLANYPHIGINFEINKILVLFLVGMIITIVVVNLRRDAISTFLKKLLRHKAFDEESAKTLDDIAYNTFLIKLSLSGGGRISKVVKRVGEKEYTYEEYSEAIKSKEFKEEKIDFSSAQFYICENALDEANRIAEMRNTSVLNTVLLCLFITIVCICAIITMPEILTIINNLLG